MSWPCGCLHIVFPCSLPAVLFTCVEWLEFIEKQLHRLTLRRNYQVIKAIKWELLPLSKGSKRHAEDPWETSVFVGWSLRQWGFGPTAAQRLHLRPLALRELGVGGGPKTTTRGNERLLPMGLRERPRQARLGWRAHQLPCLQEE